jgi:16S rRNA (guanine1516-N2)-methyltransferase
MATPVHHKVSIYCETTDQLTAARDLAERLKLPLTDNSNDNYRYRLYYSGGRLMLQEYGDRVTNPIYADFLSGRIGYRLVHGRNKHQPLAKAIGLKRNPTSSVIDATAGLGRDAVMLMALGCQVVMLERSPIVAALLDDGLKRARQATVMGILIKKRLRFIHTESITYLDRVPHRDRPDVVYLDPMYPHRTKSAKVKKEMRVFRDIVGEDTDANALLRAALQCATRRVVVKRPRNAEPLQGPSPTTSIRGKTTRFDIYSYPGRNNHA